MDVLKKFFNSGALTPIVSIGISIGFILAIGKALLFVHLNRYLELHMYHIAFDSFLSIVNDFTLIFTFITFVVFLIIFLFYSIFSYFLKDWIKGERYTCYTIIATVLLGILLVVGYRLNHLSWYPDVLSVRGIMYNTIVSLTFHFSWSHTWICIFKNTFQNSWISIAYCPQDLWVEVRLGHTPSAPDVEWVVLFSPNSDGRERSKCALYFCRYTAC